MRSIRETIQEEAEIIARLHASGASSTQVEGFCLQLIDKVAEWAKAVHGDVPAEISQSLVSAMHALAKGDVPQVLRLVKGAATLVLLPAWKRQKG